MTPISFLYAGNKFE